jgi:hypothetical protein
MDSVGTFVAVLTGCRNSIEGNQCLVHELVISGL